MGEVAQAVALGVIGGLITLVVIMLVLWNREKR
jgi:hypothetical protein